MCHTFEGDALMARRIAAIRNDKNANMDIEQYLGVLFGKNGNADCREERTFSDYGVEVNELSDMMIVIPNTNTGMDFDQTINTTVTSNVLGTSLLANGAKDTAEVPDVSTFTSEDSVSGHSKYQINIAEAHDVNAFTSEDSISEHKKHQIKTAEVHDVSAFTSDDPVSGHKFRIPEDIIKNAKVYSLLDDKGIFVSYWDLGGDELYYATHHIHLSPDAVYFLVFDVSEMDKEKERQKGLGVYLFYFSNT